MLSPQIESLSIGAAACLVLSMGLCRLASLPHLASLGFEDPKESSRRVHKKPTSRFGGIALFLPVALFYLVFEELQTFVSPPIALCFFLVFLIGFFDDLYSLSGKLRLLLQGGVAVLACLPRLGEVAYLRFGPHLGLEVDPVLAFPLFVFILVGGIHSTNLKDGLDGLAGGIVLIALVFLSLLDLHANDSYRVFLLSLPLIFSLAGFLRYNSHPAKIFMGDGGSNFIGFFVGYLILTLVLGENQNQTPYLITILGCFALPILDTGRVIFSRFLRGISIFRADNTHSHHLLLQRGFSHSRVVIIEYFIAAFIGFLSVAVVAYNRTQKPVVAMIAGTAAVVAAGYAMRSTPLIQSILGFLKLDKTLLRLGVLVRLSVLTALSFLVFAQKPSEPVWGLYSFCLAGLLLPSFFIPKIRFDFYGKFIFLVSAVFIVLVINQDPLQLLVGETLFDLQTPYNLVYLCLAGFGLCFLISKHKSSNLRVHPEDLLLVFAPTLLLFFPKQLRTDHHLVVVALRSFFLFLAMNLVAKHQLKLLPKTRMFLFAMLIFYGVNSMV